MKKIVFYAIILLLQACSDDISNIAGLDVYKNISDLPKCTKQNVFEEVVVESTGKLYSCYETKWTSAQELPWDIPKELFFNREINYGILEDERDGQKYKTVEIGNQTWMAENLNYKTDYGENYCYDDNEDYCLIIGRLYSWTSATGVLFYDNQMLEHVQGVCPNGWHLPDTTEWNMLFNFINKNKKQKDSKVGMSLESKFGWSSYHLANNLYGFSAIPAGCLYRNFSSIGNLAFFWSSIEYYSYAYGIILRTYEDYSIYEYEKDRAFSVRCVKD